VADISAERNWVLRHFTAAAVVILASHFHSGGVFAMWSDDPLDDLFIAALTGLPSAMSAWLPHRPVPIMALILERNGKLHT